MYLLDLISDYDSEPYVDEFYDRVYEDLDNLNLGDNIEPSDIGFIGRFQMFLAFKVYGVFTVHMYKFGRLGMRHSPERTKVYKKLKTREEKRRYLEEFMPRAGAAVTSTPKTRFARTYPKDKRSKLAKIAEKIKNLK